MSRIPIERAVELLFTDSSKNFSDLKSRQWTATNLSVVAIMALAALAHKEATIPHWVAILLMFLVVVCHEIVTLKCGTNLEIFRVRIKTLIRVHFHEESHNLFNEKFGDALVDDAATMVQLLHARHPGMKLFVMGESMGGAVAIGLGTLIVGFTVYEGLWMSPLGRSPLAAAAVCYLLVVALAYGLTHVISGRAAYIHVGALFGTIMTANVWMRILPASRKMLKAMREGKPVDMTLGEQAKMRTIHNTYMTVPLIFLMISNHFPTATYGASYNWLILSVLVLAGAVAAKFIYKA